MTGTVPLMLAIRGTGQPAGSGAARPHGGRKAPGMLAGLREGWTEFLIHTWLWVIVVQFCVVLMAWYAGFQVLGPVVARLRLGGPAAWGAITAADAFGLIAGGVLSLRYTPRRPMLFVVVTGGAMALSPLALGLALPLVAICLTAFCVGAAVEVMMVQWTVALATRIPSDKLARVSSYDVLGSLAAIRCPPACRTTSQPSRCQPFRGDRVRHVMASGPDEQHRRVIVERVPNVAGDVALQLGQRGVRIADGEQRPGSGQRVEGSGLVPGLAHAIRIEQDLIAWTERHVR
jgi:hypothetical protein